MHIHHIEIRFASFAAVLLIQRQSAIPARDLLVQPGLCALSGALHDRRDRSQADLQAKELFEARLDPTIAGLNLALG